MIQFWCGRSTGGPCDLSAVLMNEGLHKSGDKVQMEMNARGVWSWTPLKHSGDYHINVPKKGPHVAGGLRPLVLGLPDRWFDDGPYST